MKKIILAVTILSLALSFTTAQEKGKEKRGSFRNKKVQVTAETLAGKPYRIDLTRKGTIYEVAEGIDQSRVRVRTSTGETSLKELIRKSGRIVTGNLLVGTIDDLSAGDFGFPPGGGTVQPPGGVVMEVKCHKAIGATVCDCVAGRDCRDMEKAKICTNHVVCCSNCGTDGKRGCWCTKKQ